MAGGPWWLWRRGGGPWMDEFGEEGGLRNASLDRLLEALGYGGASGALRLGAKELPDLWLIVNAFFVFGWSVGEDLYVIPEDCSCVLLFSHEGHVEAASPPRTARRSSRPRCRPWRGRWRGREGQGSSSPGANEFAAAKGTKSACADCTGELVLWDGSRAPTG